MDTLVDKVDTTTVVVVLGLAGLASFLISVIYSQAFGKLEPKIESFPTSEASTNGLDLVVVGAGVAGASMATVLGRDGRKVVCIERDLSEPDRIVGELLQPGGYKRLQELGLADCVEGIDQQYVKGYVLEHKGGSTKVDYPKRGDGNLGLGVTFHNGRFLTSLRKSARACPNVQLLQGNVVRLVEEGNRIAGVEYRDADGELHVIRAKLTVVCDGPFSRFRKDLSSAKPEVTSNFVALSLDSKDMPHPGYATTVWANPSPVLFYPISSTETRCLIDIPGRKLPSVMDGEMDNYLRNFIVPQLPEAFRQPFIGALDTKKIRSHPNHMMSCKPRSPEGAFLLGDSFNMRHPISGGGMTVALSDVLLLREAMKEVPDLNDFTALKMKFKEAYTRRKALAGTINILGNALYRVLSPGQDADVEFMRETCFEYLKFQPAPIQLLSGLNPSIATLVVHFFGVAFFGCARLFVPYPTPAKAMMGVRMVWKAAWIIGPLIVQEQIMYISAFLRLVGFGPATTAVPKGKSL